jgi:hypothetical protein
MTPHDLFCKLGRGDLNAAVGCTRAGFDAWF